MLSFHHCKLSHRGPKPSPSGSTPLQGDPSGANTTPLSCQHVSHQGLRHCKLSRWGPTLSPSGSTSSQAGPSGPTPAPSGSTPLQGVPSGANTTPVRCQHLPHQGLHHRKLAHRGSSPLQAVPSGPTPAPSRSTSTQAVRSGVYTIPIGVYTAASQRCVGTRKHFGLLKKNGLGKSQVLAVPGNDVFGVPKPSRSGCR